MDMVSTYDVVIPVTVQCSWCMIELDKSVTETVAQKDYL